MLAVRDGDLDQLGILFDRHHRRLFAFFVRSTGSPAASDDLVQEVFLRILRYRKSFRPESRFSTWMYQIARNARIDHAKRHGRDVCVDDEVLAGALPEVGPADAPARQDEDLLRRALACLDPEKRELLVLARLEGLKHSEIGEVLGCEPGAVKVRLFRAVKELRHICLRLTGRRLTGEKVLWNART
jgi:RNA polymerase sigma-70 factor (ECF subfamily)